MVSRRLSAGIAVGAFVLTSLVASAALFRPDRAIQVATGFVAQTACAKIFVSGLDPQTVFAETTDRAGIRRLRWVLGYHLDRPGKTLDASAAGLFRSRAAFHDGFGCVLLHGSNEPYLLKSDIDALKSPKNPALLPEICRRRQCRTVRSQTEGRARSRLRGARDAAVPQKQGGGCGP